MGSEERAVKADLDRVGDQADPDSLRAVAVADGIVGAGEADRAVLVDHPQDLRAFGRLCRPPRVQCATVHLVVVIDQVTPSMGGDNDTGG